MSSRGAAASSAADDDWPLARSAASAPLPSLQPATWQQQPAGQAPAPAAARAAEPEPAGLSSSPAASGPSKVAIPTPHAAAQAPLDPSSTPRLAKDAERQVVLKIEFMQDSTTQALLLQFYAALLGALVLLALESAAKFSLPADQFIHDEAIVTGNIVISSLCLAAVLTVAVVLAVRVYRVNRAGRVWAARRKRTVALFAAELLVQLLNLSMFLAPNAFIAARPCSWFTLPVDVLAFGRLSCWNTLYMLFVVQVTNPVPSDLSAPFLLHTALVGALEPVKLAQRGVQNIAGGVGRVAGDVGRGAADLAGNVGRGAAGLATNLREMSWTVPLKAQPSWAKRWRSSAGRHHEAEGEEEEEQRGQQQRQRRPAEEKDTEAAGASWPPPNFGGSPRNGAQQAEAAEAVAEAEAEAEAKQFLAEAEADAAAAAEEPEGAGVAPHDESYEDGAGEGAAAPPAAAGGGGGAAAAAASKDAAGAGADREGEEERTHSDSNLTSHWGKVLILWLPCQLTLIFWIAWEAGAFGNPDPACTSISDTRCYPQAVNGTEDCHTWTYDCKPNTVSFSLLTTVTVLQLTSLIVYAAILFAACREMKRRSYARYRASNIMLRLQLQTRMWAAVFLALSSILLRWVGQSSCTSYMTTQMGLTPFQLVMTSLTVLNCICVLPGDPSRRQVELHVWLQDFAWTEADLPRKLRRRPVPSSEPMLCVETALKLSCWSWVVYFDFDLPPGGALERASPAPSAAASPTNGGASASAAAQAEAAGALHRVSCAEQLGPGDTCVADGAAGGGGEAEPQRPGPALLQADGDDEGGGGEELSLDVALELFGLKHYRELWGPDHDAKCLLGWGDNGTVVIAFRGTCSLRNALNNLKVWRAPFPGPAKGCRFRQPRVHSGFMQTWRASGLGERVMCALRGILSGPPPPGGAPWDLRFTGHSLGGALACLAAYEAVQLCKDMGLWARIQVYTFGCPRLGNHSFARLYMKAVPATFDIVHADDPVVRHGKFVTLYKRAAHRIVLAASGDLIVRPSRLERTVHETFGTSMAQHFMTAYGRSFAKILRNQFVAEKEQNGGRRECRPILRSPLLQRVLRVTAGVRQETMTRLGGTSIVQPPEEQPAAAGRLLRRATGSHLGSLPYFRRGSAPPDQHLAQGRQLSAQEQAAALQAGRHSASPGLALPSSPALAWVGKRTADSLSQMASAPLPGLSLARRSPPRASPLGRQPAAAAGTKADASEAV